MGFLKRDDDDDQAQGPPPVTAQEEAPHPAAYEAGSLAGIPQSGRELQSAASLENSFVEPVRLQQYPAGIYIDARRKRIESQRARQ